MSKKKLPEQLALERSILTRLHRDGPVLKHDLMRDLGATPLKLLGMQRANYIKFSDSDDGIVCCATNDGRNVFGLKKDTTGLTPGRSFVSAGPYDGAEMKPFSSRAGANDAFILPSRGYQC